MFLLFQSLPPFEEQGLPSVTRAGFFPPVVNMNPVVHEVEYMTITAGQDTVKIPVRVSKTNPAPAPPKEMTPIPGKVPESPSPEDGKYKCDLCEKEFSKAHELSMHNKVHAFECTSNAPIAISPSDHKKTLTNI
jgi:hypothetical protein